MKYRIVRPMRVTKKEENYLVAFPKVGLRILVNDNTWKFIEYLADLEMFEEKNIDQYCELGNILNKDDYSHIFKTLLKEEAIEKL